MPIHPEMADGPHADVIKFAESQQVVDVWCKKCDAFRKMNAKYAKYLQGEIENCGFCRG